MEFKDVIKRVEDQYIFIKPIGEIRVPVEYFEMSKRLASFNGKKVELFGIFYLSVWDSLEDKELKKEPHIISFSIPAVLTMIPSYKDIVGTDYVLQFYNTDIFIEHVLLVKSIENQKKVINMIFNRYIPDIIPYSGIFKLWEDCKNLNSVNLKSPSSLLELIVSEICRNPENLNENFRMYLKKHQEKNVDEHARVLVNLLDLPKYLSTFASISSANPVHGTTKSITRERKGEKNIISPVEDAIR